MQKNKQTEYTKAYICNNKYLVIVMLFYIIVFHADPSSWLQGRGDHDCMVAEFIKLLLGSIQYNFVIKFVSDFWRVDNVDFLLGK